MTTRTKATIATALVLAMCVFIFSMSAKPALDSDALSLGFVDRLIALLVPGFDAMSDADQASTTSSLNHIVRKCAHFTEFALLGALMMNLVVQATRLRRHLGARDHSFRLAPRAAGAWALSTLYAATDELHQIFVAGRSCQFTDVCIDSSGVILGVLIAALAFSLLRRRADARARSASAKPSSPR